MAGSKKTPAYAVALGGVLAALAVVVMSLGTIIPVATYICPMVCMLLAQVVRQTCGSRYGWAWYGAVAILSLLLAADKEAAAVFAALGYYPLVKPRFERIRSPVLRGLCKLLLCNAAVAAMYGLILLLIPAGSIAQELRATALILSLADRKSTRLNSSHTS